MKKRRFDKIQFVEQYPAHLRGPSSNKYGGQTLCRIIGFPGNTYGPAGPCRSFSRQEVQDYVREHPELLGKR